MELHGRYEYESVNHCAAYIAKKKTRTNTTPQPTQFNAIYLILTPLIMLQPKENRHTGCDKCKYFVHFPPACHESLKKLWVYE